MKIKTFDMLLQENQGIEYPISAQTKAAIIENPIDILDSVRVSKSKVSAFVQREKQILDDLVDECYGMLNHNGISIHDGNVRYDDNGTDPNKHLHDTAHWSSLRIKRDAYAKQSVFAADQISALFRDLHAAQGELDKQLGITEAGDQGEAAVEEIVDIFKDVYITRSNVLLPSMTSFHAETAETDLYIITDKGVYVCEVKNIGSFGKTIHISRAGKWVVKDRNGYVLRDFNGGESTPAAQNEVHRIETRRFLESKGIKGVPLFPLVVIANNKVDVVNESDYPVVCKEMIYNHLCGMSAHELPSVLSKKKQKQIVAAFDSVHTIPQPYAENYAAVEYEEEPGIDQIRVDESGDIYIPERTFPHWGVSDNTAEIIDRLQDLVSLFKKEEQWLQYMNQQIIQYANEADKKLEKEHRKTAIAPSIVSAVLMIALVVLGKYLDDFSPDIIRATYNRLLYVGLVVNVWSIVYCGWHIEGRISSNAWYMGISMVAGLLGLVCHALNAFAFTCRNSVGFGIVIVTCFAVFAGVCAAVGNAEKSYLKLNEWKQ